MKDNNMLSPWQLIDLSLKNDEFLKRLICVHYPFTNKFMRSNKMSLKWGSPAYTSMERLDIEMFITTPHYGICFNSNVDKDIFGLDDIPFETQHFNSYDRAGIHCHDEQPLDKMREFKRYFSKFNYLHQSLSSWDYYLGLDTMTDIELIVIV